MHVLLIEKSDLNQQDSLHTRLEEQGHHVALVHTPETASKKTAAAKKPAALVRAWSQVLLARQ